MSTLEKWVSYDGTRRMLCLPRAVFISPETEAYIRLAYHIANRRAHAEISGMCRVEETGDIFSLSDPVIPPQVNSRHGTDFLGSVMSNMLAELEREGKDPLMWYCWWHGHVDDAAFFSGTDDRMIRNRLRVMMTSEYALAYPQEPVEMLAGPFLSLVGNIYGDLSARVDFLYRTNDTENWWTIDTPLIRPFLHSTAEEQKRYYADHTLAVSGIITERVRFGHRLEPEDD